MKHIPRKRFGQNFLKDSTVIDAIINAIRPEQDDNMVEIGPGLGAMTSRLIQFIKKLHVIELDRDLIDRLQKSYPPEKLIIHQGDALQFDFGTLTEQTGKKLRVVGNLPYNISTPILFHLLSFSSHIEDQHFMLQKEVVERMVAEPGSKTYGRLSVMLQWRYHMELLFAVPPSAFTPAPQVESAIVRMIPLKKPISCNVYSLEKVVTQAFSQRRKILRNSLAPLFTANELSDNGIDPMKRPEEISLEQYVELAKKLG